MPTHTHAAVDLRAARAALFALVCVVLSAAGHSAASGTPVPVWALVTAWLAVWLLAMCLAGRERSLLTITTCMLGGQLGLHTLFGLAQQDTAGHGGHGRTSELEQMALRLLCSPDRGGYLAAGDHLGGAHPGSPGGLPRGTDAAAVIREAGLDPAAFSSPTPAPVANLCGTLTSAPPMLLSHVIAGLVAAWLLRRGEATLWRLIRLTSRVAEVAAFGLRGALALVRALLNGLLGLVARRPAPVRGDDPPDDTTVLLQHSVIRRGPPGYALAA